MLCKWSHYFAETSISRKTTTYKLLAFFGHRCGYLLYHQGNLLRRCSAKVWRQKAPRPQRCGSPTKTMQSARKGRNKCAHSCGSPGLNHGYKREVKEINDVRHFLSLSGGNLASWEIESMVIPTNSIVVLGSTVVS